LGSVRGSKQGRLFLIPLGWLIVFMAGIARGEPGIAVSDSVWDFGEVTAAFRVGHAFRIKNTGDAEILIQRVETTCGCAVAVLNDSTIKPGKEVYLRVTLNAANLAPETISEKKVTLMCSDPREPVKTLALRARLSYQGVSGIAMEPRWIRLKAGERSRRAWEKLVITNQDMGPFEIKVLEAYGAVKEARVTRHRVPRGGRTVVRVLIDRLKLRAQPEEGSSLTLGFRGDRWEERVTLPVEAAGDTSAAQTGTGESRK
jgi:hypothetical protein